MKILDKDSYSDPDTMYVYNLAIENVCVSSCLKAFLGELLKRSKFRANVE